MGPLTSKGMRLSMIAVVTMAVALGSVGCDSNPGGPSATPPGQGASASPSVTEQPAAGSVNVKKARGAASKIKTPHVPAAGAQ
jgi:hypothetical protein